MDLSLGQESPKILEIRARSQKRRKLLNQQFGLKHSSDLSRIVGGTPLHFSTDSHTIIPLLNSKNSSAAFISASIVDSTVPSGESAEEQGGYSGKFLIDDSDPSKFHREAGGEGATVDCRRRPQNDYPQHFVDTGTRPQNYVLDLGLVRRFEEFPKLREMLVQKDELVRRRATPALSLRADLRSFHLSDLGMAFDVMLLEPPLEEHARAGLSSDFWRWDEIEQLEIDKVASERSFVWLWAGSTVAGLEAALRCISKWGFRRVEDIVWSKTNKHQVHSGRALVSKRPPECDAVFQKTKEHCLMGMRGSLKRDTDSEQVHANIDLDVILEEEPNEASVAAGDRAGATAIDKPEEVFHVIEHFCQLRRRLHLFGRDSTLRPGWVTVGPECGLSTFDPDLYARYLATDLLDYDPECRRLADEIERARPKSPSRLPPPQQSTAAPAGAASASKSKPAASGGSAAAASAGSVLSVRNPPRAPASPNPSRGPPLHRFPGDLSAGGRLLPPPALMRTPSPLRAASPMLHQPPLPALQVPVFLSSDGTTYLLPPTALGALRAAGPPLVHAGGAMHQFGLPALPPGSSAGALLRPPHPSLLGARPPLLPTPAAHAAQQQQQQPQTGGEEQSQRAPTIGSLSAFHLPLAKPNFSPHS